MNLHRTLAAGTLVLLAACGSDKEPAATATQPAAAPASASTAAPAAGASTSADDVSHWAEEDSAAATPVSATPERLADPDAVIDRYQHECSGGAKSPECHALRLDVEGIFLASLLAVRAANTATVDPRWYRLAAVSETPQLQCIGLNELIWDPQRTAQDEAVIVRALESPYRAVRAAVWSSQSKIPALAAALKRQGRFNYPLSGYCVEDLREPVPAAKWAGGYPGAQFRPFASDETRRWFTTPDPLEKVIAWFAARGKPARTAQEMTEDAQAKLVEEMTRLSQNPDQDNTARMMQLLTGQASSGDWSAPFRDMEDAGEIRYVLIGDEQSVAIFRDDALKATSIVAIRPVAVDIELDLEAAKEEAEVRSILGY